MFPSSHRGAIKSPLPHAWDRGRESERAACVTCGRAAMQAADDDSLSTLHWTTAAVHLELGWHCLLCPHGPAWAGLWLTGHGRVKGRLIEHADEREMSSKYCRSCWVTYMENITCSHSFGGLFLNQVYEKCNSVTLINFFYDEHILNFWIQIQSVSYKALYK